MREQCVDFPTYMLARHPAGLAYGDAVQACFAVYCADKVLPEWVTPGVWTRSAICDSFALLARRGGVRAPTRSDLIQPPCGIAPLESAAHWNGMILQLLKDASKLDTLIDVKRVLSLLKD